MSYISIQDPVMESMSLVDEIELTDAQLEAVYGGHGGCDDNQCDDNQCDDNQCDDNHCHNNDHKCRRHHHHNQCHFQNHCCW